MWNPGKLLSKLRRGNTNSKQNYVRTDTADTADTSIATAMEIPRPTVHSDEALFKQPPQNEDCTICCIQLPTLWSGQKYQACCGKTLCSGCQKRAASGLCPFCRTPAPKTEEEIVERNKKRIVEKDDAYAIHNLGSYYHDGSYGMQQNIAKAIELWHRSGELGNASAYHNIGCAYSLGDGVVVDKMKANHYWELAAILGHVVARHNLGVVEENKGNIDRALKHFMISAGLGCNESMENIKELFTDGYATEDDYEKALSTYQAYVDGIRSELRDKAAAFNDRYIYY